MTQPSASSLLRTNSLALAFQDVFTVVLRTRFQVQRWDRADRMRAAVKQMIGTATQNVRAQGYSDESAQMALYAIVGFLDESVLNSRDPVFADWAGKTLQEEMWGSQLAGEYFFQHITELLNRPESSQVADTLELHCLCLLLGYRGRFAYGDASGIDSIIRRIQEKIVRIRGPFVLARQAEALAVPKAPTSDAWVRKLSLAALALAGIALVIYVGYFFLLVQGVPAVTHAALQHAPGAVTAALSRTTEICL